MSQFSSGTTTPPPGAAPSQKPNIPLILVALGLGLVAVIANTAYIHNIRSEKEANKFTIYLLQRSFAPGDELEREDLKPVEMYEEARPHYVEALKALTKDEVQTQIGQRFKRYANQNQFLTYDLFTDQPGIGDGSATPREGMVWRELPVDDDTTVSLIVPNSTVDIQAYLDPPSGKPQTYLILERVRVVAVGGQTSASRKKRNFSKVTVEVEPVEANLLSTILRYSPDEEYELVLRNPNDLTPRLPDAADSINPRVLELLNLSPTGS